MPQPKERDDESAIVTLFGDCFRRTLRRALGSIEIIHIPERGIWTSVGLSREQFFAILLLSVLLFLFLDEPAWRHPRDSHTVRIVGGCCNCSFLIFAIFSGKSFLYLRRTVGIGTHENRRLAAYPSSCARPDDLNCR